MNWNNIKVTLTAVGVILLLVLLSYAGWNLKRTVNYKWYYQDSVRQTIREEVKPLQDRITKLEQEVKELKNK